MTWTRCSASRAGSRSWSTARSLPAARRRRFAPAPRSRRPISERAPLAEPAPIIEAVGVHAFYGASHVLHGVDLVVRAGETIGLMGRNGMGKTTLLRAMVGLVADRRGVVRVKGVDMSRARAHAVARRGVAYVPEGRGIFPNLTVRENLVMAARAGS